MTNTIDKKTHTLVKENTPRYHKIRQNVVSLKRSHFSVHHCVFFPRCCVNIGREVRLVLPNTYQEIYNTRAIHALIFEKYVKMCVYIRQINP